MNKEIEKIIVDILKSEMELDDVYIGSQNINLGSKKELQIVISNVDSQVLSNVNEINAETELETQKVVMLENIQIDLFSKDTSARSRRAEVLMALQSYYSLGKQEQYQFKIFRSPISFVNSTIAEGGSMLNRYTITIPCHVLYVKTKEFTDIYESFPARVDDENTIDLENGMIEFEL